MKTGKRFGEQVEARAKKPDEAEGGLIQEALLVCPRPLPAASGLPGLLQCCFRWGGEWPGVLTSGSSCEFGMTVPAFLEKPPAGLLADLKCSKTLAQQPRSLSHGPRVLSPPFTLGNLLGKRMKPLHLL